MRFQFPSAPGRSRGRRGRGVVRGLDLLGSIPSAPGRSAHAGTGRRRSRGLLVSIPSTGAESDPATANVPRLLGPGGFDPLEHRGESGDMSVLPQISSLLHGFQSPQHRGVAHARQSARLGILQNGVSIPAPGGVAHMTAPPFAVITRQSFQSPSTGGGVAHATITPIVVATFLVSIPSAPGGAAH